MTEYNFYGAEKMIEIKSAVSVIDAEYDSDFDFKGESHDFWELVYVVNGRVGIMADERLYTLSANDVILHKPMEFHRIWTAGESAIHVYIFSFSASGEGMENLKNRTMSLPNEEVKMLESCMELGKKAFYEDRGIISGIRDKKIVQMYFNTLESFLMKIEDKKNISFTKDPESKLFSEIIKTLESNIYGRITVDYVAGECYISTAKLKKLFNRYTGMGVLAYFNKMKIKKAMELLPLGYSVAETSQLLAYSSRFYFERVFKNEIGISPSEYRKKYAQKN